ncbi:MULTISPECIES: dimethylarginine dimethylaminohydrolase family protein [Sphingobacterium]|uniref:Amidinotransferase n=1 Tax=Sphingobacterium cellulitidis TaxID=1768011 RepID=A0A8H9FXW8_9SPHI|nr:MULTISPECIES: arginine deiminase family protein [Sphingobacterium]MBA8984998.1 N-dimethylarginine dimethylaminohydrolase [Sphingobacterium soli]WFB63482.1 arginine deiminase family protein [Sphingobacterium sp. WM]GGE12929.1 amidinotransferase [Sphingobacterium soli]
MTTSNSIFVQNEFAPLKKVVLAASEFGYPMEVRVEDLRFLGESSVVDSEINRGKDYSAAHPDIQAQWEMERSNFKKTLEKHGVEVVEARKLTEAEKQVNPKDGYANFFTRDPFFVVGNYVIEAAMRFLHRRHEVWPLRDLLWEAVHNADCTYVSAPFPQVAPDDDLTLEIGPFIEGGDVLVLNNHVLVGCSGLASNKRGFQWLSKLITPLGYIVEQVRLHPNILHLDCALGFIKPNLMVVCEEAFLDGIPSVIKNWNTIPVTLEEAGNLATNGLPLSTEVYVTDPVFKHIGDQIEQYGVKVEYVDFKITRSFGGSFRCSTQPLLRFE